MSSRILVIDDNIDLVDSLALLLETDGYEVTRASDIASGRRAFLAQRPDLLVLDVRLPDGNGIDFYYEIKTLQPRLPVLVMTGYRLEQIMADTCGLTVQLCDEDHAGSLAADISVYRDREVLAEQLATLESRGRNVIELSGFNDLLHNDITAADYLLLRSGEPLVAHFSLVAQLRRRFPHTPFLLFPGMTEEGLTEVDEVSWTGCLLKPFDPADFVGRVRDMAQATDTDDSGEVAA